MGVYLKSIEQLKAVPGNYDVNYLWDCKFEGAPPPFDKWFPAGSVDEPRGNVISHSADIFMTSIQVPKSTKAESMTVTFYDDSNRTLQHWIEDWMGEGDKYGVSIFGPNKASVRTISECARNLFVAQLDYNGKKLSERMYSVYPDSAFKVASASDAAIRAHTVEFAIVGSSSTLY